MFNDEFQAIVCPLCVVQNDPFVDTSLKSRKIGSHLYFLCVPVFVCVVVLPDSPNFPYRRYDRLPPISQFSIESDSDLSETAELIEEYEVFDPSRPRPKVILVIGKRSIKQTKTIQSIKVYKQRKNEETMWQR